MKQTFLKKFFSYSLSKSLMLHVRPIFCFQLLKIPSSNRIIDSNPKKIYIREWILAQWVVNITYKNTIYLEKLNPMGLSPVID